MQAAEVLAQFLPADLLAWQSVHATLPDGLRSLFHWKRAENELRRVGIQGPAWLGSETWAMPAMIIMSLWGVGGGMLIYLGALQGIPTVLTVHDVLYRLFPRYHKPLNYTFLNLAMPLFCRRADAIIAVSEHTKADLVRYYGLPPQKITVIHEAAAPHFRPQSAEAIRAARVCYGLPERYVMTLCVIEPRKNHAGFLRAFEQLCRHDPDLY